MRGTREGSYVARLRVKPDMLLDFFLSRTDINAFGVDRKGLHDLKWRHGRGWVWNPGTWDPATESERHEHERAACQ